MTPMVFIPIALGAVIVVLLAILLRRRFGDDS